MFFIFGWGFKTVKKYGILTKQYCSDCNKDTEWELVKITQWLTVFFIPIIPTNAKRFIICNKCGKARELEKDVFENIVHKIKNNKASGENDIDKNLEDYSFQISGKTETQRNFLRQMKEFEEQNNIIRNQIEEKEKLTEQRVIEKTDIPNTKDSLVENFKKIGLKEGMTVIVHSSLSSLGWVCGGAVAVIEALMEVITEEGNIIMPSHSGDLSDPANWMKPPVPQTWVETIKNNMPPFDPMNTPTRSMGIVSETFRKYNGVKRSNHPTLSFAAWGKDSYEITNKHSLSFGLSKNSPLGKIYDMDGYVLLLGVSYDSNTSFHLAEYDISHKKEMIESSPIIQDGKRIWKEYKEIQFDTDNFSRIGKDLEDCGKVREARIGNAQAKLFKQKDAVDFAKKWLSMD